jgi:6-phosphofructokinase 1
MMIFRVLFVIFIFPHFELVVRNVEWCMKISTSYIYIEINGSILLWMITVYSTSKNWEKKHWFEVCLLANGSWLLSYSATTFVEGCTVHLCVTLLCGCQVKDFFSKAKVPVDAKYIDPTYMIRALPCNSSDHIVCSILGQNAVCTLSLSFSFFTLCLVFHLPVIIYAGNLFRDNVLLCTPYVI